MVNERMSSTLPKTDIYRDTGLRYLGYAGSLGWICRALLPFQVSSMISVAYVCADLFDKANETAKRGRPEDQILVSAADTVAWHFLASLALPGFLLTGLRSVTSKLGSSRSRCRGGLFYLPCLFGGLALPLISKPIDCMVDNWMDNFVRNRSYRSLEDSKCKARDTVLDSDEDFDNNKNNKLQPKHHWFFEQSRDLDELERYREKMRARQGAAAAPTATRARAPNYQAAAAPAFRRDFDEQGPSTGPSNYDRTTADKFEPADDVRDAAVQAKIKRTRRYSENENDFDDPTNKAVQVDRSSKPPKNPRREQE